MRDDCGRFGWRLSLPTDEPAAVMAGYLNHLDRRLPDEALELGAFQLQTDADLPRFGRQTETSLIESVGSCGFVHRRGERSWIVIAPVGPNESGEFVQWLQQGWSQAMLEPGGDVARPQTVLPFTLAITIVGHVPREAGIAGLTELMLAALAAPGPLGNEPPIVVISRSEPGWVDGLSRRLQQWGCSVTRISDEAPCPDEWSQHGNHRTPLVLDLRTPGGCGWSRLDDLVREGSLNRHVFLLTEDLRRQIDLLSSFGTQWESATEQVSISAMAGSMLEELTTEGAGLS